MRNKQQTLCEWNDRCRECVELHSNHKDHVPACFYTFINDKLKAIAKIGELTAVETEKTPIEYRSYFKEQDKRLSTNKEKHGEVPFYNLTEVYKWKNLITLSC